MRKLLSKMIGRSWPQQQVLDWKDAWYLFSYKEFAYNTPKPRETLDEGTLSAIHERGENLAKHDRLEETIQTLLENELIIMFSNLNDYETQSAVEGQSPKSLTDLQGFELEVKESRIPNAGQGVFVKSGSILPGTVVGLYPGKVHLKEFVIREKYLAELLPDPELMLMCRQDQVLIDGRDADRMPRNPYAIGHKINHCPKGSIPNILHLPLTFTKDSFPELLRKYIPNEFARKPGLLSRIEQSYYMQSVALLSKVHLKAGDELYMDYRMSPSNPNLPTWYHVADEQVSNNIWLNVIPDKE